MSQEPSEARATRRFVPPEAFDEPEEDGVDTRPLVGPLIFIGTCLAFAALAWFLSDILRDPDVPTNPQLELAAPSQGGSAGPNGEAPRPASGRLTIGADLPDGSWVEIDGERVPTTLGFGSPLRLSAGIHRIVVRADGYHPWTAEIEIPARTTVRIEPHLVPAPPEAGPVRTALTVARETPEERERPANRTRSSGSESSDSRSSPRLDSRPDDDRRPARPQGDQRPARPVDTPRLPEALLDSLALQLEQGRVLQEIERYAEAAVTFQAVIDQATSAEAWPYSARLAAVKARADSALAAIARSCEGAARPGCE